MWQRYNGTGQPGSRVIASSDFGVADVTIGESGTWTVKLWLEGAPAGTDFGVYVSNTESSVVTEFRVQTPTAAPEPPPVEFTATAAWVESAASPAFNEYSGTAQPGTKVLISSPYGSAERVAGTVKELPMKRVEPI
jgi:hypothetical protein